MDWRTTMTKQGLEILAGLGGGNPVVSAWAGTGFVPQNELKEQTQLVNKKQQLAIIEDGRLGNKRITRLQVTNNSVSEKYTLNQIGIFVSFDGGEPVLYYIAQNEDGDVIPSNLSVKGFIAEYITVLVFAADDTVEYDGSVTGLITPDALDNRLSVFMDELELKFIRRSDAIVSETEPTDPYDVWLRPMGKISIAEALGGGQLGGGVTLKSTGVYIGNDSPSDKKKLWLRDISV